MFSRKISLLALVLSLAGTLPVRAGVVTWDGDGGDNNWYTPANWSGDTLPTVGDDARIDFNGTITVDASSPAITVTSITIGGAQPTVLQISTGIDGGHVSVLNNGVFIASGTVKMNLDYMTIASGGLVTHSTNAVTKTAQLNFTIAQDFNLASGGKINISSKGYVGGITCGAGAGIGGGGAGGDGGDGAGHGSGGGTNDGTGAGGVFYDILTNPSDLGSQGGDGAGCTVSQGLGGAGGGQLTLVVLGSLSLNGEINADGARGADGTASNAAAAGGGGSGGTININALNLSGSGSMHAVGGAGGDDADPGDSGGGGAGGRILQNVTGVDNPSFVFESVAGGAKGSEASATAGAPGTNWPGPFVWDGEAGDLNWYTGANWNFDIVPGVGNDARIDVAATVTVDASSPAITVATITLGGTNPTTLRISTGIEGGHLVVQNNGVFLSSTRAHMNLTTVTVLSGGVITHSTVSVGTDGAYLYLAVAGDLNLQAGGRIDVSSAGFNNGPGACDAGAGTGGGKLDALDGGSGAGHGGAGGSSGGGEAGGGFGYGPPGVLTAANFGSQGGDGAGCTLSQGLGGAGGGLIFIYVGGGFALNGEINADGAAGQNGVNANAALAAGGGGSGGGIFIKAASLSGTGIVHAAGGKGGDDSDPSDWGSGGGGGRVSIEATGSDSSKLRFSVDPGPAGAPGMFPPRGNGGAGTVLSRGPGVSYYDLTVGVVGSTVPLSSTTLSGSLTLSSLTVRGDVLFHAPPSTVFTGSMTVLSGASLIMVTTDTLTIPGDAVVRPGGRISHAANAGQLIYSVDLNVGGNLTIPSGAAIDVSSRGYVSEVTVCDAGAGPGGGNVDASDGGAGGGHGGAGGLSAGAQGGGGIIYGSLTAPVAAGSQGGDGANCDGGTQGHGGAGGGLVDINVTGTFTLGGVINADGARGENGVAANAADAAGGGGAGGGIRIAAATLLGGGYIHADGGAGGNDDDADDAGAGGAGGRISVDVTGSDASTLLYSADPGPSGDSGANTPGANGGVGTIALRDPGRAYYDLLLGVKGSTVPASSTTIAGVNVGSATIRGDILLHVAPSSVFTGSMSVVNGARLIIATTDTLTVGGDVVVRTGGVISHAQNAGSLIYAVNLNILGNLDIQTGASIDVSSRGYLSDSACSAGAGPGGGNLDAADGGTGGGHGGVGGQTGGTGAGGIRYGALAAPVDAGSQGGDGETCAAGGFGGAGGGLIRLAVAKTLTLNGELSADGSSGNASISGAPTGGGGGAGGAIYTSALDITGAGVLHAVGGTGGTDTDGGSQPGGGGGGGRIRCAISGADTSSWSLNTSGGASGGGTASGGSSGSALCDIAVTRTWDGGGADNEWYTPENWNPDGTPGPNDVLTVAQAVTVTAGTSFEDIYFSTLTLGANNPTLQLSTGIAGAAGALSIQSGATFVQASTRTLFLSSVTVAGGGILTHAANTASRQYALILSVSGDMNVAVGGRVDVSSRGYAGGASGTTPAGGGGPGGGGAGVNNAAQAGGGGGGHGGVGGGGGDGDIPGGGAYYDTLTGPADLGSGGGGAYDSGNDLTVTGGPGGGAIILSVGGTLTASGEFNADGSTGTTGFSGGTRGAGGGGAGGSINITAATLAGLGYLHANGGVGGVNADQGTDLGGGGAGGRIKVDATASDSSSLRLSADPGGSEGAVAKNGASGTIALRKPAVQLYDLLLGPRGSVTSSTPTVITAATAVGTVTVRGALTLHVPAPMVFSGSMTVLSGATLTMATTDTLTIGGDAVVRAGSTVTHKGNAASLRHEVDWNVGGGLTIEAGSVIDVSSRGYSNSGSLCDPGAGPGGGAWNDANGGGGGAYGGAGAAGDSGVNAGGTAYGSASNPVLAGSQGGDGQGCAPGTKGVGGAGGGLVTLVVAGALTINGGIQANGQAGLVDTGAGSSAGGGGAGGGVNLTLASLAGSGFVTANGGDGGANGGGAETGGGGGGGRIALNAGGAVTANYSAFSVAGGASPNGQPGEKGSLPAGPTAVTDLAVGVIVSTGIGASSMTVTLTWTAPSTSTAGSLNATYDIRWRTDTSILSDADFDGTPAGNRISLSTTIFAQETQSYSIPFLDAATTHYFAIKTIDRLFIPSALSNPTTALSFIQVTTNTGGASRWVGWADYDNDGVLELGVANAETDDEFILEISSDGAYAQKNIGSSAQATESAAWGDFDNDGDLDLVTGNSGVEDEYLLRNVAGVSFAKTALSVPGGLDTRAVAWGDFDNDGDLDLAVINRNSELDYVGINNGDGASFSFTSIPGTNLGNSQAVALGDYDNDGDLDMVAAGNGVLPYIIENDGFGGFSTFTLNGFSTVDETGLAWGDFDNDGDLDFAAAVDGANDYIGINNGDGTFTQSSIAGTSAGNNSGIAWGDFNNDGWLDLAGSNAGADAYIAKNNGDGTFTPRVIARGGDKTRSVTWGDYDGDGDLDAAFAGDTPWGDEFVLRNDVSTTAANPAAPTSLAATFTEYSVFSTSGVLTLTWNDAADTETSTAAIRYLVRVGTGAALNAAKLRIPPLMSMDRSFLYSTKVSSAQRGYKIVLPKETTAYMAVKTEDGSFLRSAESVELAANLSAPAAISNLAAVIVSTGLGASTSTVTLSWTAPGTNGSLGAITGGVFDIRYSSVAPITDLMRYATATYQIAVATAVNAGDPQTYIIDDLDSAVTWYFAITTKDDFGVRSALSNAATGFSYIMEAAGSGGDTYGVAWADIDGDGDIDFVDASDSSNKRKYVNNGDGTFTGSAIAGTGGAARGIAWGDFDNDGDLDAAIANFGEDQTILKNDGSGGFTEITLPNTVSNAASVAVGDFDNDGDLDLVTVDFSLSTVTLYTNNGALSFSSSTIFADDVSVKDSRGVAAGDMNNDGLLDIVIATHFGQETHLLKNNGNGTFTSIKLGDSGNNSNGIALGDYDADGDLDIALANSGSTLFGENNHVLRNNGALSFTEIQLAGTDKASMGVAWADLNNDGRLDLVFSNYAGGRDTLATNVGGDSFAVTHLHPSTASAFSFSSSLGDYDADGDLDLAVAARDGFDAYVLRNDTVSVNTLPGAPASGLSAVFSASATFATQGTLQLRWGDGTDAETPASGLEYYVNIGTTTSGSSTTARLPLRYGFSGSNGGRSFLRSTRLSGSQRGVKVTLQVETTAYWRVVTEDGGFARSPVSALQTTDLSAPARIPSLTAAINTDIQTSSNAWITLTFTAPGEDGFATNLAAGSLFDVRWSTSGNLNSEAKYETAGAVGHKALVTGVGTTANTGTAISVAVEDPAKTYTFAITTLDQYGVRSALSPVSNSVSPVIMREEVYDIASPSILQSVTTGFLKLRVWTDAGTMKFNGLTVRKIGTLPDAAVQDIAIYDDLNNLNQTFNGPGAGFDNNVTAPAVFTSSVATILFDTPYNITTATATYFVGVTWNPNFLPVEGATIAIQLAGGGFLVDRGGVGAIDFPGLTLDGIDDGGTLPYNSSLNPGSHQVTVEAWVKTTDTGADRVIVSKGDATSGYRLWLNGDGCGPGIPTFYLGANNDNEKICGDGGRRVDDGRWHHIAAAFDSSAGKRLWVDGITVATGTLTDNFDNTDDLGVGKPPSGGLGNPLQGQIDEVRISADSNRYETFVEFTPPKRHADGQANTVALYHFDAQANPTLAFKDDSPAGTNALVSTGTPAGYARSTWTAVIDAQDVLVASVTSISPATMFRNQDNVGMMKLKLWTESDFVTLEKFFLVLTGQTSGVNNLSLYLDNGDESFDPFVDAVIKNGVSVIIGTATFDLTGGSEQDISRSTRTYFVALDVQNSALLDTPLGLSIAATENFTLSGSTDAGFTYPGYPLQSGQPLVVSAEAFITPEQTTGTWVNVSSIVFRTDFSQGNVNHFHYVWDQIPGSDASEGSSPEWNTPKATVTATADTQDWYMHARAFDSGNNPGTLVHFGPFWVDVTSPTGSSFRSYDSTGGAMAETQFLDLARDVTAELLLQDLASGLNFDGPAPVAPDSGTVSLWHFDEPSGTTWADAAGAPGNTLFQGNATITRMAGRFKTAVQFGSLTFMQRNSPTGMPVGNSNRTFEAWIYPLSTGSTRGIASWGDGTGRMRIALESGLLAVDMGTGYVAGGTRLSTGVWQHVGFSFDGSVGRYFVGGVQVGSNTYGAVNTAAGTLYVGQTDQGAGSEFLGGVDEVRILDVALSAADILNDYVRGDPYYVSFSTANGTAWQVIASTDTTLDQHVTLTGTQGILTQQTFKAYGLDLVISTTVLTGASATNQVRFHGTDVAGNVLTAGPFGILVDTNTPIAISTPTLPGIGTYVVSDSTNPDFHWTGPRPGLVYGINGLFYLEVDENDPAFGSPVISISTPALVNDPVDFDTEAVYRSSFSLTAGSTYYWRVRARSNLGVFSPWSLVSSFVTDVTTPAASSFRVFDSTGGAFLESGNIDLLTGVTAQILLEDLPGGPAGLSYTAHYPSTTGVLGYWSFDEVAGANPFDSSGSGNAGTLACGGVACSSATYAATPFGAGLRCDNTQSQGVTVPNTDFVFPVDSDFTIEAWIYSENVGSNRTIAGIGHPANAGRNYTFSLASGKLQFRSDTGSAQSNSALLPFTWYHVALVAEGQRITFYIDGAYDKSEISAAGNSNSSSQLFTIGVGIDGTGTVGAGWKGIIDEVRVVGHALDSRQVAADYAATAPGRYSLEYSTNAGNNWRVVSATYAVPGYPYLVLSGNSGSVSQETLQVRELDLTHSTTSATGYGGTNLLRFSVPDLAGNRLNTTGFTILVDTVAAVADAAPRIPADGAFVGIQPNFAWAGPSTMTVTRMGPAAAYLLEVDDNAGFTSPEISISSPVITQSTDTVLVSQTYVSTFTLADHTTFYWRVRTKDFLGLFSQAPAVSSFVTDFDTAAFSGFVTYSSTGGRTGEGVVNDLLSGVTAELLLADAAPNSGLSIPLTYGTTQFGVVYTTQGSQSVPFWIDSAGTDALWSKAFSDNTQTAVEALTTFGGELYAGARGAGTSLVFKYNGVSWSAVGAALPGTGVKVLRAYNNKLYAGLDGDGRIYSWSGAGPWTLEFNTGQSKTNALKEYDGRLYAATGGTAEIWAFDPASSKWYRAFDSPTDPLSSLEVYNGNLFAGGQNAIYVSSGTSFAASFSFGANFLSLQTYNGRLYAGSSFGGNIYSYNGASWAVDHGPGQTETNALAVHDGRLYAGVSGVIPGRAYVKDGRNWMIVEQLPAAGDKLLSLEHFAGRLYAGAQVGAGGAVYVSSPLAVGFGPALDGSNGQETLTLTGLNLAQSASPTICGASPNCTANNQVRFTATDRAGGVTPGGPFAILVDTLLSQPTAAFPAAGEFVQTLNPTFLWQEATVQPRHDVQVSLNDDMSSPFPTENTSDGRLAWPTALLDGTTYYWRVRSYNAFDVVTAFSAENNFIVDVTPPAPSAFRSISSTAGLLGETNFNNLALGTTVQINLQDLTAGLALSTSTVGGSHILPGGNFSVMYSTDAGGSWNVFGAAAQSRGAASEERVLSLASYNDDLYAGHGSDPGEADIWKFDGTAWSQVVEIPSQASFDAIHALAVYKGKLYAGLGGPTGGDGDVLEFNGAWSVSFNGSAPATAVRALAVYNGKLYAGQAGASGGDGDIQVFDGSSWSLSTGTAATEIRALAVFEGRLYAGGQGGGIRFFDGKTWGEDATATASASDEILALKVYNGKLFAGTDAGQVRVFTPGSGWSTSTGPVQGAILSLAVFDGKLFAGQGGSAAGDGDVLVFDGQKWVVGYDGAADGVFAMTAYKGKLYAGLGGTTAGDGDTLVFSPLPGTAFTGTEGSLGIETLSAYLNLVNSTHTGVCGGTAPCSATNQVSFNATDRAGNVRSAGPYAVLVDTSVPRPLAGDFTVLAVSTRAVFVHIKSSDNLAGLQDFNFIASTSPVMAVPISSSDFITVDSFTFTNLLVATTYYFTVTARDNVLNYSTASVVVATSTFGTVFYTGAVATPADGKALQGGVVPMLRMYLQTPSGTSQLTGLKAALTGTAVPADVAQVQLRSDLNGNGVFDPPEGLLGGAGFSNGASTATIILGLNSVALGVQISTVFVTYQMTNFATVGNSIGLDIALAGDILLEHPDNAEGSFPTSVSPVLSTITDGANTMTVDHDGLVIPAQNASPSTFNVLVQRLDATISPVGTSLIDKIVFHMTGDLDPNQITRINVFRDRLTPGVFDPSRPEDEDKLTGQLNTFVIEPGNVYSSATLTGVPASSRTVTQVGGEFFFVTVDISASADQGKGFQIEISTPADIILNNPSDSVAFTTAVIRASTVTIAEPNIVTFSTRELISPSFVQGKTYAILMATITVRTAAGDPSSARIDRVKVNLSGSAGDADIAGVALYKDFDSIGPIFVPAVDVLLGSTTFAGGQAFIDIVPPLNVSESTTVVYLVYAIATDAADGNTLSANIPSALDIRTVEAGSVLSSLSFPINTTLTPIAETVDTLLIPSANTSNPSNIKQGATNKEMLRFELKSGGNDINWSSLTLERLGNAPDTDVTAIRVYRDDGSGVVKSTHQLSGISGDDTFISGLATIALESVEVVTATAKTFIVTLDISNDAVPGSSIAVRIATNSAIAINTPNYVSTGSVNPLSEFFPIDTGVYVPIQQFDNAIVVATASIVPPGGALPGTRDVGIMYLRLNTDVSTSAWKSLLVERIGASVNADIAAVKIYFDKTGGGIWDSSDLSAYTLLTSSTQSFGDSGPNDVLMTFTSTPTLYRANHANGSKGFFLVVDVSSAATPDNQVTIRTNNDTYFSFTPAAVPSGSKFTSPPLIIAAPQTFMYVVGTDTAPATVIQNQKFAPMEKLEVWMDKYSAKWSRLSVTRKGSGTDADVEDVRLFDDTGAQPGSWDTGDQELTSIVGTFSGGVATLNFATQTITVTTQTYFITYNIDAAADGTTVGVEVNNSGDLPISAPHITSNLGFPLTSALSAITKTRTGLNVLGFPAISGNLVQAEKDRPIISMQLNTTTAAVTFTGLTVRSTGTASDSDITAVNLWYDTTGDGFDPLIDTKLTGGNDPMIAGFATLSVISGFKSEQTVKSAVKNFYVTVDVAPFADDSKTFGLVIESTAGVSVASPNFVIASNFPAPSSPPVAQLKKASETLHFKPTSLAPAGGVNQSTTAVMIKIEASASRNSIEWTGLQLEKLSGSTLEVSSLTNVQVYRSSGGVFVEDAALILGSATFSVNTVDIVFASSETVTVTTQTYYVTVDVASGAIVGKTFGLRIAGTSAVTVTKSDGKASADFPLNTVLVPVLDNRTPSQPLVTLTDGASSNNFEYVEFRWSSLIGTGQIIGASYAIGTSSGANDVFPGGADPAAFSPISAGDTQFKAKGFGLISGTTYYVSVKVQSQVSPDPTVYTSPVGVSAPILMDFQIPAAPAPNLSANGSTVLFTWAPVGGGPSGIRGYIVEFRTGAVPVWKNAKTGAKSTLQFSPAAAVPASDVITGNSFQATGLPSGTVFLRMRTVSGSGQSGPASAEVKLLVGSALEEGLSQVSAYPNPFDSRKEKATIHFALGASGEVSISIYSIYGRLIKTLSVNGSAGSNEVVWDGSSEAGGKAAKGMYLAVIDSGASQVVLKIGVRH